MKNKLYMVLDGKESFTKRFGIDMPYDTFGVYRFMAQHEMAANWGTQFGSFSGFGELDRLGTTEEELGTLVDQLSETEEKGITLLDNPALLEFEMLVSEPVPSVNMTFVRFLKTTVNTDAVIPGGTDDETHMKLYPRIDAYISFEDKNVVDCVITIFSCHFYIHGKEFRTGTAHYEMWRRNDKRLFLAIKTDPQFYEETLHNIKLAYLSIQFAMRNRPSVFKTKESGMKPMPEEGRSAKSEKSERKKTVKLVRTIYVNADELKKYSTPHRQINCPSWGVIGHWRNYRNGKRVWIAPYKKGKKRNEPETYRAKEYEYVDASSNKNVPDSAATEIQDTGN